MKKILRAFALCFASLGAFGLLAVGCGSHPGGSVGDECSSVGSSDECAEDEICDSLETADGEAFCLRLCEDHPDCDEGESCNGVSGSNLKGCHPAAE